VHDGFRCPDCGGAAHCILHFIGDKVFQCNACRYQTSLIAGTVFQLTKLSLTIWFLAIYLVSQAKTGLSALALKRQLGVSYPTAWLMQHKLMQAMTEREALYTLSGKVQVDDTYLGGERTGGKVGRGSENKVAFVAAVSLTDEGNPMRVKLSPVSGFKLKAIADWAKKCLTAGSTVYSDGLACFGAVTQVGCTHECTGVAGCKPKDVPELQWINTVLVSVVTSSARNLLGLFSCCIGCMFGEPIEHLLIRPGPLKRMGIVPVVFRASGINMRDQCITTDPGCAPQIAPTEGVIDHSP